MRRRLVVAVVLAALAALCVGGWQLVGTTSTDAGSDPPPELCATPC